MKVMNQIYRPKAHAANQLTHGNIRITLLTKKLLRLEIQEGASFVDEATQVVWNREFPRVFYTVQTAKDSKQNGRASCRERVEDRV